MITRCWYFSELQYLMIGTFLYSLTTGTFLWAGDESYPPPHEIKQSRSQLSFWLDNMLGKHKYSREEAALVTGYSVDELKQQVQEMNIQIHPLKELRNHLILPYLVDVIPALAFWRERFVRSAPPRSACSFLNWKFPMWLWICRRLYLPDRD